MKAELIVVAAFNWDDEQLLPAFEPFAVDNIALAKAKAEDLSKHHDGVIAWSRSADLDLGQYGPPEVIVVYGDVPEMD